VEARTGGAVRLEAVVVEDGRVVMEAMGTISSKGDRAEPPVTVETCEMVLIIKLMCSPMVFSDLVRDDLTTMAMALDMLMVIIVLMVADSLVVDVTSITGGTLVKVRIIGSSAMAVTMLLTAMATF
jgi:hypothetical protein